MNAQVPLWEREWPASPHPFHCAIHGTVTRCPFRYMFCDGPGADLADRPSLSDYLGPSGAVNHPEELTESQDNAE